MSQFGERAAFLGTKERRPERGKVATEWCRTDEGDIAYRYHDTAVATLSHDGWVVLRSGGWLTPTTKERMCDVGMHHLNAHPFSVGQRDGVWYVSVWTQGMRYGTQETYRYAEGMRVNVLTGEVEGAMTTDEIKEVEQHNKRIDKLIERYLKGVTRDSVLDAINDMGGDCWFCLMKTNEGTPLGDATGDTEHLRSHLEEVYVMGSLIINAVRYCGRSDTWLHLMLSDLRRNGSDRALNEIKAKLRGYFRGKLYIARVSGKSAKQTNLEVVVSGVPVDEW